MNNKNNLIVPFLILGFSIVIGIFIFVGAWKSNQSANQTITVTGSAKKEIISDLGFLRGTLTVQAPSPENAFRVRRPAFGAHTRVRGNP
ncbi:MAG: hypothetical protein R6W68_06100 [Ignavibacteriaceae bacterium]